MARYKPYSTHASWDDIKEDYLLWEKEQEEEPSFYDELGFLTVGMKGPVEIMKGFDKDTSIKYYSLDGNTLELYTSSKLLAGIAENVSEEEFENFQSILPYGAKEI